MPANIPRQRSTDPVVSGCVGDTAPAADDLLPLLQSINKCGQGLGSDRLTAVASTLGIPAREAGGVAGFYYMLSDSPPATHQLRLCDGVVCWLKGAGACLTKAASWADEHEDWEVCRTSCLGLCDQAPAAIQNARAVGPLPHADQSDWSTLAPVAASIHATPRAGEHRVLLARHGRIHPRSLDEALCSGVYSGLRNALQMSPGEVVRQIEESGLRGRGGAGFPCGRKWRTVAQAAGQTRYVICNADESEPLMFKDRVLIDGNPHAIIEGISIAAYAVGAAEAFIYVRGEYEAQARLLEQAVHDAADHGLLRDDATGFRIQIHIHRGAGAYICGEESALIESLEGRRGEPRVRPPYPATAGYRGQPTVVNNVETLTWAARILSDGADSYRSVGPPDEPGTRLFTLLGHVCEPGLVEVTFGKTLHELLDMAGGPEDEANIKFALVGGAAGRFVSPGDFGVPLTYSSEIPMGSGGILFCDESLSAVALTRELMHFFEVESCGKCTPCRIGTSVARETLDRLLAGTGRTDDLNLLLALGKELSDTSFCGLGTGAAEPLLSALESFADDFTSLIPPGN